MDLATGGFAAAVILGLLLGLRHALDADHVVAVSTIVSEERNVMRGVWIGASWGLGHTTPLLIVGLAILVLKETFLDRLESFAPALEFGVGAMLVYLGVRVFLKLRGSSLHLHEHTGGPEPHLHVHAHPAELEPAGNPEDRHGRRSSQVFRLKSYIIGIVHGMAGSAAVMLLLVPQAPDAATGIVYILLFGAGTVIAMSAITVALGVPFAAATSATRARDWVSRTAGAFSCLLGAAIMVEISTGFHMLPFLPG